MNLIAAILIALATLAQPAPCGYADGLPWWVIVFGSDPPVYAPCPSDVTPTPAPPTPEPAPLTPRRWMPLLLNG